VSSEYNIKLRMTINGYHCKMADSEGIKSGLNYKYEKALITGLFRIT